MILQLPRIFCYPFAFIRLDDEKEVLVNEVGDHLVVSSGTVEKVIRKGISKVNHESLYADLLAGFFISEERIPPLIDVLATRYRTKKSFFGRIHFITLICNNPSLRTHLPLLSGIASYRR